MNINTWNRVNYDLSKEVLMNVRKKRRMIAMLLVCIVVFLCANGCKKSGHDKGSAKHKIVLSYHNSFGIGCLFHQFDNSSLIDFYAQTGTVRHGDGTVFDRQRFGKNIGG